jgi:hypothetical protein
MHKTETTGDEMKKGKRILFLLIIGLIVSAAVTRLLPHPPNFTPVIAIALVAGAYFYRSAWAWILPLAVMIVSDLALWAIHGYEFFTARRLGIYTTLLLIVAIGIPVGRQVGAGRVLLGSLAGAILFFIVTNFAVWASGRLYPMSWEGLLTCYTAAIPFFRHTLLSTLLYSGILFGAIEWARSRWSLPASPVAVNVPARDET